MAQPTPSTSTGHEAELLKQILACDNLGSFGENQKSMAETAANNAPQIAEGFIINVARKRKLLNDVLPPEGFSGNMFASSTAVSEAYFSAHAQTPSQKTDLKVKSVCRSKLNKPGNVTEFKNRCKAALSRQK